LANKQREAKIENIAQNLRHNNFCLQRGAQLNFITNKAERNNLSWHPSSALFRMQAKIKATPAQGGSYFTRAECWKSILKQLNTTSSI